MADIDFLVDELKDLKSMIIYSDYIAEDVSEVSVAWHLDHTLKVINRVIDSLRAADPDQYKYQMNLIRTMVFARGKISRGKGQSPKVVLPPDTILTQDILKQLNEAEANLKTLDSMHPQVHFKHPAFGVLDLENSKRFLNIHTSHHLAIIRDIIREKEKKNKIQ